MSYPTFEDVEEGMKVLVELKNDRGTGKLTEGIVEEKISTDDSDPSGIIVDIGNTRIGRVREILNYDFIDKNNSDPVISIEPNQGIKNRTKVIKLLSESEDFIYLLVGYWKYTHFEILTEALENNDSVTEIKIMSILPLMKDGSLDQKEFEKIEIYGKLFKEDMKKRIKKTSVNLKFLTEKKVGGELHARFYFTKNKARNFIDLGILQRNQREDICRVDKNGNFEKKLNDDFYKYWNQSNTIGIFGDEKLLLQKRLDELEHNRLEQLKKENKRTKK